ncbi:AAA family ATPase [Stieleria varia]|uniref:Recombination protein F n=1 Tax=Stieleria varia TaxID=2528005 RepID=A0A5C6A3N1_9BACT|nr:ATP-binding protein [Stieleria varia]TWT93947.1 recombination protein F [Stieleria varia]
MLKTIRVTNFKAIASAELELSPLHLLIGPNDSGKTSFLEAIAAISRSLDHALGMTFLGRWNGQQLVHSGSGGSKVSIEADIDGSIAGTYRLEAEFPTADRTVTLKSADFDGKSIAYGNVSTLTGHPSRPAMLDQQHFAIADSLKQNLCPCWYLRWSARNLSLPATLSPERHLRIAGNGFGLPTMLDDLLGESRENFGRLEKTFCSQFPGVVGIELKQEKAFDSPVDDPEQTLSLKPGNGKQLYFRLENGASIPAPQAAEGMLYTLAYLAISYLPDPPKILLVEEPENGIHPGRVREIVRLLRKMTEQSPAIQIIMTSHSPYLVDEMKPNEVTWCRRVNGSITTQRLDTNETVRQQQDLFELGEIWSNYLDPSSELTIP